MPQIETLNPLGGFAAAVRWKILDDDALFCASDIEAEVAPAERERRYDRAARLIVRNYDLPAARVRLYLDGHCGQMVGHQVGNLMLQGLDFDTALESVVTAGLPALGRRQNRAGRPIDQVAA